MKYESIDRIIRKMLVSMLDKVYCDTDRSNNCIIDHSQKGNRANNTECSFFAVSQRPGQRLCPSPS